MADTKAKIVLAAATRIVLVTRHFQLAERPGRPYYAGERLMLDPETLARIVKARCGKYVSSFTGQPND